MKQKQGKNIIIAVLCCLILLMGVGFAILSTQLNINGNANITGEWDIYIESITPIEEGYTGVSSSASVDQNDKTKANFTADLKKPRDFVEYKVVVKNDGNIDAFLEDVVLDNTVSHKDVKFSHTAPEGEVLYAGDTTEFTVKVEFLEEATTVSKISVSSTIELNYEQYDPNYNNDDFEGTIAVSTPVLKNVTLDGESEEGLSLLNVVQDSESTLKYELYGSNTMDGEYELIKTSDSEYVSGIERTNLKRYYKIRNIDEVNGVEYYSDYSNVVEIGITRFFSAFANKNDDGSYRIGAAMGTCGDGIQIQYSKDDVNYNIVELPSDNGNRFVKILNSDSEAYPAAGTTNYYTVRLYLEFDGERIYSLDETVTITNEN